MSSVEAITAILSLEEDAAVPSQELLPLVYAELRRVAQHRLSKSSPGQTVQATDLVHEAWLRVVGHGDPGWRGRTHFFGAAANAMRNILVERARANSTLKRDVHRKQSLGDSEDIMIATAVAVDDILTLDEALARFEGEHSRAAELVKLRFFCGCSTPEAAKMLDISLATAERDWRFARAWLQKEIGLESD